MLKQILFLTLPVLIIGCAKPTAPESLTPGSGGYEIAARLVTPGYAQDLELNDTLIYVAQGEGGIAVVSVAVPTNPRLLSICYEATRGYSYKIARRDSIVFLATGGFGINTFNVGNPYAPVHMLHSGGANSTNEVAIFGTWLLEAKGEAGIRFDDLSEVDPGYMNSKGTITTPGYAHGMTTLADSTLLVACGEMGLATYDLRDVGWYGGEGGGYYDTRKQYASWVDLPGYAVHVATMDNRHVAFVACGTAGVQVVDFSDTSHLSVIGGYSTGGYAKEVAYSNGRLYVTTELRGLQILSVSNTGSLALIGVVETKYALGLAVSQHYVYVADQTEGLVVVKIP